MDTNCILLIIEIVAHWLKERKCQRLTLSTLEGGKGRGEYMTKKGQIRYVTFVYTNIL